MDSSRDWDAVIPFLAAHAHASMAGPDQYHRSGTRGVARKSYTPETRKIKNKRRRRNKIAKQSRKRNR